MGYACPVCETPQRDGEHLAHHLAFTAMLHGGDHEAWLDDRVSDWSDREPAGLAAEVTPHAEDAEYHEVFEDTVDRGRPNVDLGAHDGVGSGGHDHGHAGHGHSHGHASHEHGAAGGPGAVDSTGEASPEVADAIREAREMAQEMSDDEDSESDGDDAGDGDGESDAATSDDADGSSA